jgi:hypothetical protein
MKIHSKFTQTSTTNNINKKFASLFTQSKILILNNNYSKFVCTCDKETNCLHIFLCLLKYKTEFEFTEDWKIENEIFQFKQIKQEIKEEEETIQKKSSTKALDLFNIFEKTKETPIQKETIQTLDLFKIFENMKKEKVSSPREEIGDLEATQNLEELLENAKKQIKLSQKSPIPINESKREMEDIFFPKKKRKLNSEVEIPITQDLVQLLEEKNKIDDETENIFFPKKKNK